MTDVDQNIEMHVGTFRLLERIGGGGFASVYRAISFIDGAEKLVAVKQSRAPLRLKRPMLQHEARVLQLLQGHPTIPLVYAYGHLAHFEFLSIELLGPTLGDLKAKEGPLGLKRVAQIAVQMISALKHVHDHGIVHRDIKPSNILVSLDNPDQVRLADFGIATPIHSGAHNEHGAVKKNKPFIGTLSWASLNAHEGCDPSPRDDLESIAYTLLDLIRDKLPWERYDKAIIPILRRSAHVKKRKMGWNGARFALGPITEFGELLDYARSLEFNDRPDYDHWCGAFNQIPELGRQAEGDALVEPGIPPTCIVSPGQLVFVQVLAKPTIEGYVNDLDDYSYWHDSELCTKDWVTKFRPAIVLKILERNGWNEKYDIHVLPITQGEVTPKDASKNRVRIIGAPGDEGIVVPDWPLEGTYCYSFPYPEEFVPVPQASDPVPAFWRVSEQDLKMLIERFRWKTPIPKSDSSLYRRMENRQTVRIYVDIKPMLPETLHLGFDSVEIDWKGERGWFDELLKIFQKASADDGNPWTGMGPSVVKRAEWDDSYFDFDMSEWDNRQDDERSCSLTLSADLEGKLDNALGQIEVVEKDLGNSRRVYRAEPRN